MRSMLFQILLQHINQKMRLSKSIVRHLEPNRFMSHMLLRIQVNRNWLFNWHSDQFNLTDHPIKPDIHFQPNYPDTFEQPWIFPDFGHFGPKLQNNRIKWNLCWMLLRILLQYNQWRLYRCQSSMPDLEQSRTLPLMLSRLCNFWHTMCHFGIIWISVIWIIGIRIIWISIFWVIGISIIFNIRHSRQHWSKSY